MAMINIFAAGSTIKVKSIDYPCTVLSATIKNNNNVSYKVSWDQGDRYSCEVEDVEVISIPSNRTSLTVKSITSNRVTGNSRKVGCNGRK